MSYHFFYRAPPKLLDPTKSGSTLGNELYFPFGFISSKLEHCWGSREKWWGPTINTFWLGRVQRDRHLHPCCHPQQACHHHPPHPVLIAINSTITISILIFTCTSNQNPPLLLPYHSFNGISVPSSHSFSHLLWKKRKGAKVFIFESDREGHWLIVPWFTLHIRLLSALLREGWMGHRSQGPGSLDQRSNPGSAMNS